MNRRGFLQGVLGLLAARALPALPATSAPAAASTDPFVAHGWWASYARYHLAKGYNLVWERDAPSVLDTFLEST